MYLYRSFIIALIGLLVGCSGGTIGGLFPAPKFLKGEIRNNIYTAPDKSFSVSVPHKEGFAEYTYMQVKENYSEVGAYVSFGPAATDQSIYRLEVAKRTTPGTEKNNFETGAKEVVKNYGAQLERAYSAPLSEMTSGRNTENGKNFYYWKFRQVVPPGKISNRQETLVHEVFAIDFGSATAIVGTQILEEPQGIAENHAKRRLSPRGFAESVTIH